MEGRAKGEEGRGRGEERGKEGKGVFKIRFWNVAGLGNKDKEFWDGLREWDVVVLSETWVHKKGWERVKNRLPKGYIWEAQWAIKEKTKGRAKGGMVFGVRKELKVEKEVDRKEVEGILERKICLGGDWWRVIGVYVNRNLEAKLQVLREWVEE